MTRESPIEGGVRGNRARTNWDDSVYENKLNPVSCKNRPGILYLSDSQIRRPVKLARQAGRVVDCVKQNSIGSKNLSSGSSDRQLSKRQF
ncbi:hypothetical protein T07_3442 [Trichinella nelsoni]|uniref:Uncharacterized protein n=1 Tax=Trichinella nelsoni TaxID=6336 RepID=A0A0V0RG97_9BILA|nr:hypothetical protein T07_3442 [Trichinella nelsoni]